jgi:hypothetical protein
MIGHDEESLHLRRATAKRTAMKRAALLAYQNRAGGDRNSRASASPVAPDRPAASPRLRLVGFDEPTTSTATPANPAPPGAPTKPGHGDQTLHIGDPRWVLAVRAAESLQGDIMPPQKRRKVIQLGRVLGLSPFDSNLIIAIVQDQARRGQLQQHGPQIGAAQLSIVPLPQRARWFDALRGRLAIVTGLILAGIIAVELILLMSFMRPG